MAGIIAGMDNQNQVRVEIEIRGLYKTNPYSAIVDTGFSGGLALPLVIAVDLGLEKAGASTVTLADGSVQTLPMFLCKVKIGQQTMDVSTLVLGNDILMGMELLNPFKLCLTPGTGNVTIDPASSRGPAAGLRIDKDTLTKLKDSLRSLTSRQGMVY